MIAEYGDADIRGMRIVYDGECPFCSGYVRILRLRDAVGPVTLVNARDHPELVTRFSASGHPIDEGMIVEYGGTIYHGEDAMRILSLLSEGGSLANRVIAALMRDRSRAKLLYPLFRAVRNMALSVLGRRRLDTL